MEIHNINPMRTCFRKLSRLKFVYFIIYCPGTAGTLRAYAVKSDCRKYIEAIPFPGDLLILFSKLSLKGAHMICSFKDKSLIVSNNCHVA